MGCCLDQHVCRGLSWLFPSCGHHSSSSGGERGWTRVSIHAVDPLCFWPAASGSSCLAFPTMKNYILKLWTKFSLFFEAAFIGVFYHNLKKIRRASFAGLFPGRVRWHRESMRKGWGREEGGWSLSPPFLPRSLCSQQLPFFTSHILGTREMGQMFRALTPLAEVPRTHMAVHNSLLLQF